VFENLPVKSDFRNQLEAALDLGRLSHALIFEGSSDEIRFIAALELAKAILCKGNMKPCGICSDCIKADSLSHPDIHIISKPDDSAFIKVDTVRDIRSKALLLPNEGAKSVFIIKEAQLMNANAQNALLKIFEEPQSHVIFILTCPSKASLLETVISRATSYRLGEEAASEKREEADLFKEKANALFKCFISENEVSFMKMTAEFQKDRQLFIEVLKQLLPIVRDAIVFQSRGKDFLSPYEETAKRLASALTAKKAIELYSALSSLVEEAEKSANHNLTLTRLSSKLYDIKNR